MMRFPIKLLTVLSPWPLKRLLLQRVFGFRLAPTARIGLSWIFPAELEMAAGTRIGHLNVAVHLGAIRMGEESTISRGNWITGFPKGGARHFLHQPDREPVLVMGEHSAITKDHHIDCTNRIEIGPFTTIAGYKSQLLTHSINVQENRQDSAPIRIGSHCFVGTDVVILGGAILPDRSVLGAKSLLNKAFTERGMLYAGVPAKPVAPVDGKYFTRTTGFVD